ncbi:DNA-directed primase/polymerase protein [Anguilla anguilla]|uniref:DNA-directed primase/polymerase protein n=1 Tax=Anguilla anguilla TaxID=7936 RepID=UPI0015A78F37|nr:DNA-directed primase/polymerase protein [Anguilla anguilla]
MPRRSNWGNRVKNVESLALSFQHCPLANPYKPRLSKPWQPETVWRLFPRQSDALSFAKCSKEDVHVFALEKDHAKTGQRIFLVTSYTELWHYYKTYRHSLMHCYEVIPEGAVCKLYFDLEFHKPSNRGRDGRQMVLSLIQFVCGKLEEVYGVKCSAEYVLNLDSSTEEKFSRHLIFLLPNAAFKDNIHVGHFIHKILQPALDTVRRRRSGGLDSGDMGMTNVTPGTTTDPLLSLDHTQEVGGDLLGTPVPKRPRHGEDDYDFLFVKDKEGLDQLFVDLGVYTKNRNFRLYRSSKAGKNAAFTAAEDNAFVTKPDGRVSAEESIFLSSLVSNVSFTGQKILMSEVPETKEDKQILCPAPHPSSVSSDSVGGYQHSPYKEVDDFVLSLVTRDGVDGGIRRWSLFVCEQLLVYDILRYRWCQNVGRHHKSNNIMILVDLKKEVWYQKCHDPVCRSVNYRSSDHPLPEEVCLSHFMREDEEEEGYEMDEAGTIEPRERSAAALDPTRLLDQEEGPEREDDWQDDHAYLQALEDAERSVLLEDETAATPRCHGDDLPDDLLLQTLAEFETSSDQICASTSMP